MGEGKWGRDGGEGMGTEDERVKWAGSRDD